MELVMMPRIGEVIKEYRDKAGWSQEQLGIILGIDQGSRQRVYAWESGDRTPSAEYLLKLCAVLHIPLEAFDEYKGASK